MLKKRKFEKVREKTGNFYHGIGLLNTDDSLVYSLEKPYTNPKMALEAASSHVSSKAGVGYVGFQQKVSKIGLYEGQNTELSVNTIHTIHQPLREGSIKPPVEPDEAVVYSLEKPYTETNVTNENSPSNPVENDISSALYFKKCDIHRLAASKGYPRYHYQYGQTLEGEAQYTKAINDAPDLPTLEKILRLLKRDENKH